MSDTFSGRKIETGNMHLTWNLLRASKRTDMTETANAEAQITELVTSNDVVLFMKGTKSMPQCGFSSRVAGVLNYMGVEFQDVNVLADEGVRQGSRNSPTGRPSPSSNVKGEFVGGCDIITEMTLSGDARPDVRREGRDLRQGRGREDPRSQRLTRRPHARHES